MADRECYGPNDPTMSTSIKTPLKNRLRNLLSFFAIIPIHHVTSKKQNMFGAEEKWPHLISDRDGRIYRLADPHFVWKPLDHYTRPKQTPQI